MPRRLEKDAQHSRQGLRVKLLCFVVLRARGAVLVTLVTGSFGAACAAVLGLDDIGFSLPADAAVADDSRSSSVDGDTSLPADAGDGGPAVVPETISTVGASLLVADDDAAYWLSGTDLVGLTQAGARPNTLVSSGVVALLMNGTHVVAATAGSLAWLQRPNLSSPTTGSFSTTGVIPSLDENAFVYHFSPSQGLVRMPPPSVSSPQVQVFPLTPGAALAYAAGTLYFYGARPDGGFGLHQCTPSATGCTGTIFLGDVPAGGAQRLVPRGNEVVWVDSRGLGITTGGAMQQVLPSTSPAVVTADAKYVYYADGVDLVRVDLATKETRRLYVETVPIRAVAVTTLHVWWVTALGVYRLSK